MIAADDRIDLGDGASPRWITVRKLVELCADLKRGDLLALERLGSLSQLVSQLAARLVSTEQRIDRLEERLAALEERP